MILLDYGDRISSHKARTWSAEDESLICTPVVVCIRPDEVEGRVEVGALVPTLRCG